MGKVITLFLFFALVASCASGDIFTRSEYENVLERKIEASIDARYSKLENDERRMASFDSLFAIRNFSFVVYDTSKPIDSITGLPPVQMTGTITDSSGNIHKEETSVSNSINEQELVEERLDEETEQIITKENETKVKVKSNLTNYLIIGILVMICFLFIKSKLKFSLWRKL